MMKTEVIKTPSGIYFIRVVNAGGAWVELCTLGARWTCCWVPDVAGHLGNVVLGAEDYAEDRLYRGAIVGRVANRIVNAEFELDGQTYHLDANDGHHSNHGGFHGFDARRCDYRLSDDGVTFMLTSVDGDGGYPGRIDVEATYRWDDDCRLTLRVTACTDRTTLFNPTCHAYFNLSGGSDRTIAAHDLQTDACRVVETDSSHIPSGRLLAARDNAFDFRGGRRLGTFCYNHCLDTQRARLRHEGSGRCLEVSTSPPGLLLYTSGWSPRRFEGVCLEPQYWPDAIHHAGFECPVLRRGERYDHTTVYHFYSSLTIEH